MLKEFAQYLAGVKENKIYVINGDTYSDNNLFRIAPHVDRPEQITVSSLDSIAKLIKQEIDVIDALPVFVRVKDAQTVTVFTTFDEYFERDNLYKAVCDVPEFREGFRSYEKAIIELRSKFIPGEGTSYLLDLLSRVNKESGVSTSDNGVTQTVEARSGVSLKQMVAVKPRVLLQPFRTFLEVRQPESEFLLRINDDGDIGLFEADGGAWRLSAKDSIAGYLESALAEEIAASKVVVMK